MRNGRLLPTRADVERVVDQRRPTFARILYDDVLRIRKSAVEYPVHIQEDVIGGRVRVRVACQNGASGILYVAITRRLLPGVLPLPPEWEIQLHAEYFPGVPLEDIEYIGEIAGHNLRSDEAGYCGLIRTVQ